MSDSDPFRAFDAVQRLAQLRPQLPDITLPRPPLVDLAVNQAKWMHERLVRSIVQFESGLDDQHEIGARLVSFSEREPIHIEDVGFWGPDLIIFDGRNLDGHPVQLLQHVTQISVLLVAVPKAAQEARRIGFELQKKLESSDGSE
jgi:hypothetical protein